METHKLNGLWKGIYRYGDGYSESYKDRFDKFSIDIVFDGDNFKGICQDKFTDFYFKQPATVEGTFAPNLISFIKRYPSLLTVNEKDEIIVDTDRPSLDIHYTGMFYRGLFSRTVRFEGEWIMTDYFINELGKKQFYSCSGSWYLKKKL